MNTVIASALWDLRFLRRTRAGILAAGVIVFVVAIATATGFAARRHWQAEVDERARVGEAALRRTLEQIAAGDPDAKMPMFFRTHIALPPAPAVGVATGRSDLDPRSTEVSAFTHASTLFRDYQTQSPTALAAGRFDLAFVIIYLLPLMIIALGYGLLAEERDRGIDRVLRVHGVRPWALALGRVLARSTLCLVPIWAGLAMLLFAGGVDGVRVSRHLLIAFVVLGYAGFWWALVLLLSSYRLDAGATLLALLLSWCMLVLAVPAVIGAVARAVDPAPSRFQLIGHTRRAEKDAYIQSEALLGGYVHDHPSMDPKASASLPDWMKRNFLVGLAVDAAEAPVVEGFDAALRSQRATVARWQMTTPALAAHRAITTLAGTDEGRSSEFRRQARAFSLQYRDRMGVLTMSGQVLDPQVIDALPRFAFTEPSTLELARSVAASVALLWTLALALALATRLRLLERRSSDGSEPQPE